MLVHLQSLRSGSAHSFPRYLCAQLVPEVAACVDNMDNPNIPCSSKSFKTTNIT
jgi:hypothetical protein